MGLRLETLGALAWLALAAPAGAQDHGGAGELVKLLGGVFAGRDSHDQTYLRDWRQEIAPLGEGRWLYFRRDRNGEVYRERIVQLLDRPDGSVVQETWRLPKGDVPLTAARLRVLARSDLSGESLGDCPHVWRKEASDWRSEVDPQTCVIHSDRRGTDIRIGSESRLSATQLIEAERGFALDGTLLWGTPLGEFATMERQ